jgi:hypothetical protein
MFERVKQAAQKMEKNLTEKCEKMRKYSRKKADRKDTSVEFDVFQHSDQCAGR